MIVLIICGIVLVIAAFIEGNKPLKDDDWYKSQEDYKC